MTSLRRAIAELSSDDLVLRCTALVVLVYGGQSQVLEALFVVCTGAALVFPSLLRRASFWFAMASLSVLLHGLKWIEIDNHQFLLTYWMLAIALALRTSDVTASLAHAARLLIGACFACGVFWKLFGGQFVDGSFLSLSFLINLKFESFTKAFGGIDTAQFLYFRDSFELFRSGVLQTEALSIAASERLESIARVVSYATLAIEGAIAIIFLLGDRVSIRLRHALLIGFIVVVYPVATVPGFACVLVVMRLSDVNARRPRLREVYLLVFALSVLSFIPKNLATYFVMLSDFFTG